MMTIRAATTKDVKRMVELSDVKRTEYAGYSLIFWRKAAGASEKQEAFFDAQLERASNIVLVAEQAGHIEGFLIASLVDAPPVYDPGGKVCMIDDFAVSTPDGWQTIGQALLSETMRQAKSRGSVLSVIVCGHLDEPKRTLLRESGATIASEWYVAPLN